MPSLKTTLFFRDSSAQGWSENFWYNSVTVDPDFTTNISGLVAGRAAVLTNTSRITHVRVDSGTKRAPFVFALAAGGTPGTENPPTAVSEAALLVRIVASGAIPFFNRPFLRGIPQRILNGDSYSPDGAWNANLNQFIAQLTNGLWNVQGGLNPTPPPPVPITSLIPTPPRGIQFVSPGLAAADGDVVRIKRATIPGYNGLKTILSQVPATHTFLLGGASPPVADTSTNAECVLQTRFDLPIGNVFAEGISRRAAGRPFGQSPGRGPTLYSLRQ